MDNRVVKHTLLTPNNNHMEEKIRKQKRKKRGELGVFIRLGSLTL
jgi:hypothetical protein